MWLRVRFESHELIRLMADNTPSPDSLVLRRRMIDEQIHARGLSSSRVVEAMLAIPRELFVPPSWRHSAYDDRALPIAAGQTISQPYIVAYMTDQLAVEPHHRVLEVGTGSGYQCAILSRLAGHVYTVERHDALRLDAERRLFDLGAANVTFRGGDGSLGLLEFAPYDRIIVTAAAPKVPKPLIDQLADGGRLVIPVGRATEQTIVLVTRIGPRTSETYTIGCRFVKLIGEEGWRTEEMTS